ncbi:glycoside hydrolase family 3 protein [Nocardioides sp.]|uniref:glycoside hydrolase family 3 protein n=1 Tax=Nocardioides sp. TaxID=35761 RepID=UPI00273739A5|nr:glycoside hydrolase family 3 N-terminal domain-containing protein [Nocardioides sp.]MDP3890624.1 glycoside hydrolase family 3 N-terminal domain-containing protein [Nocardioides sp.]
MPERRWVPVAAAMLVLVAGCTGERSVDPGSADPAPTAPTLTAPAPTTVAPRQSPAESLGLVPGWGPDRATLDRAARLTGAMSLPELAGQVIVARYDGTAAPVDLVRDLQLGGVIVFGDNVASGDQIAASNEELRRGVEREWPLFIGVDQEGGIVARATEGVTAFPAFMSAGAAADTEVTRAAMHGLGSELADLGFSVDFAPTADVTTGPRDPTIGSRSVGSDAAMVVEQVEAAVTGFRDAGVIPVIKHFPGHGSVPADSHEELPVQTRTRAELDESDLVPFAAAAQAEIPAVMVGHIDVRAVDPGVPSSLSRKLVTGVLRDDLGFDGLVVTDALDMAGVADGRTSAQSAVQALRAGSDVLLMPPDPRAARQGVIDAVRAGDLDRRRLRQAAARQVALLLHQAAGGDPGPVDAPAASRALSAAAVTVASGPCEGRLVGRAVRPVGSSEAVVAFSAAAERAGLVIDPGSSETVAFTGFGGAPVSGAVAVATDTPYVLGPSRAPVKIATYGLTPGAMDALVAVLLGEAPAPGRLPVPVEGVERRGC